MNRWTNATNLNQRANEVDIKSTGLLSVLERICIWGSLRMWKTGGSMLNLLGPFYP